MTPEEIIPIGWWDDLLPDRPYDNPAHPPGSPIMLRLIAYDIALPKRWRRIAAICQDYGIRVQYSLFECWLDEPTFDEMWFRLEQELHPEEDRIAVWVINAGDADRRRGLGEGMTFTEKRVLCYLG